MLKHKGHKPKPSGKVIWNSLYNYLKNTLPNDYYISFTIMKIFIIPCNGLLGTPIRYLLEKNLVREKDY